MVEYHKSSAAKASHCAGRFSTGQPREAFGIGYSDAGEATDSRGSRWGWAPISGTPAWGGHPHRLPRVAYPQLDPV